MQIVTGPCNLLLLHPLTSSLPLFLTYGLLGKGEGFQHVEPIGDVAQLGLVRLLQAEKDQVDGCDVVGRKVVIGAVINWVPRELPHAEVPNTYEWVGMETWVRFLSIQI